MMLSRNDTPRASIRGGGQERRLQQQTEEHEQDVEELSEAYVHSLASLGLERLQNEPGRLHAEAIAVDEVSCTEPPLPHRRCTVQETVLHPIVLSRF